MACWGATFLRDDSLQANQCENYHHIAIGRSVCCCMLMVLESLHAVILLIMVMMIEDRNLTD